MNAPFISTACPHDCPSTCALEVERLDDGTIGKVRGARENDYTAGVICAKVSNYRERVHHPDRLGHPLKRVGAKGEGKFARISWDEALDEVVHNFKRVTEKYGSQTVWPYDFAGTMGLLQRSSIYRLRHAMNYSNQDSTICVPLARNGWRVGCGDVWGTDPREIPESDLIVVWGGNPVSTQVNVMTHIAKARKQRGAKLVVVDAYRTPTAEAADVFIAVRPGTDGALACAVMHVLFKEGFADWDYMRRYTDDPEALEEHLKSRSPEWASPITGVPIDDIVSFARLYGGTERSFIRAGYGFSRSRNGSANMHAVSCLPAITGAWRHRGGGGLHTNADLYKGVDQTMIMGLDVMDPSSRALDMCRIGAILGGEEESLLGGPPVSAMLVQNVNPADVAPDTNAVLAGLAREDMFLCVHEQFMTHTARYADIVLPATMFVEHEDFYRGGGHVYLQVHRAIIDPFEECRPNTEVINELGQRLGSNYPGFYMSGKELIDASLKVSGLPDFETAADQRWIELAKDFDTAHFLDGFGHADGKFHFSADWSEIGADYAAMPVMPDHLNNIDEVSAEKPFRLIAPPARRFLNTSFTEMPSSRAKEVGPEALIHPAACERLGVAAGDSVRLGNELGNVVVPVRPFDGLREDVVVVEGIWPSEYFQEGLGINALISADRPPPAGGGAFHDTSIWVRAA
ncbi:MAG: molybdopterin oxidoreductase family protein [Rhodospirillaceae bacterium]|jgi:anaerobic selenocysteine-containing dehydrogenase|nr:molybdopterin oxidoreductase family protein [Rhodospirillaceae bacterium]MBT6084649.1 molybdopterin oxidoreductase family protein [Rhodospirillaceae bacterium]